MTTGTASRHGVSTIVTLVYLLASVSAVTQDNRDKEKVRDNKNGQMHSEEVQIHYT